MGAAVGFLREWPFASATATETPGGACVPSISKGNDSGSKVATGGSDQKWCASLCPFSALTVAEPCRLRRVRVEVASARECRRGKV